MNDSGPDLAGLITIWWMDQWRARVVLVLLVVAVLPVLVGVRLLPWALRGTGDTGHSGTFTVQQCDRASLITWRCTGSFADADAMACEGEPSCPSWEPVALDDPRHWKPGATVWATMPIGEQGADVQPGGWQEPVFALAVISGLTCYLAALATAAWRRLRLFTTVAAAASIVPLASVTIWLLA